MAEELIGGMEVLDILRDLERRPADDQTPIPDMVTKCTVLELPYNNIEHIPNTIDRCINVKKINLTGNKLSSLPCSLSKLKHLTHLNLNENQLTELPAAVCTLPHIENLNLQHNKLSSLPSDVRKMTTLKSLNLRDNEFAELPASVCAHPHIENLDLEGNNLSSLPSDVRKMTTLKSLNLRNNEFAELPPSVCILPQIENLDLRNNDLSSFPPVFSKMTKLRCLYLGHNEFTELPPSVCALPHIEYLDLEDNKLSSLPSEVRKMTTLKIFILLKNQFTELPASVCALPHIEYLDLRGNKLSGLPSDVRKMTTLKSLTLGHNEFKVLPTSVCALPHIQNLDLQHNKLSSLPSDVSKMTSLKSLNLEMNELTELPASVCALPHIENLNLRHNRLSSLPPDVSNMTSLKSLNLRMNELTELPASVCALPHIENLDLQHNKLSSIHTDICKITTLKYMNLQGNQLKEIPASLCALPHIEYLDLQHNKLSSLPSEVRKMTTLKSLNLGYNEFTELPVAACALPNIENLDLLNNKLSSLPPDVRKLTSMKSLNVRLNRFTQFPASVCALPHLQNLDLSWNQVSSLPPDVSKMTALKSLRLEGNQLSTLPASVCALSHIQNLNLEGNNLSSLPPDVSKMTTLKSLNLGRNQFTELPAPLCALPHIENLDLSENKLSNLLTDVSKMTTLKSLNLEGNQFTEFPDSVCALPHIENLNLSCNMLSNLPPGVSKMTTLKILDISSNQITHLPHQLALLTLDTLNVVSNPIQQPPLLVCMEGEEAIFSYLSELRESKVVQSCRIQLNLLGETESGKTSLARSLRRGIPVLTDVADRTRVVEQSLWEIEGDISFNINDFGGHDVYRVGHRIFISQNSIVLVTFDLSTYDPRSSSYFRQHIGVWIDMVQSHNPGVTIALVGTHLDKTDEATLRVVCASIQEVIEEERIKRQDWFTEQAKQLQVRTHALQKDKNEVLILAYKRKIEALNNRRGQNESRIHPHIFMVSSKTQAGFGDLKDYLAAQAKERSVTLPQTWHEAAKTIYAKKESKTENTLCWDNVKQDVVYANNTAKYIWSKLRQRTDNNVNAILAFLSSRGDVIWYPNNPILRNTIFHRQEVLADLLKAILSHDKDALLKNMIVSDPTAEEIKEDYSKRGVLSVQVMEALWKPFGLTAREASAMVELMQRLELCFKVDEGSDGTTFHFPWLLKQSCPSKINSKWPQSVPKDTTQLTLKVYFPYRCPVGLYEKLSVRLHSTLGLYQPMRRDWRDGVFVDMTSQCMQMTRSQTDRDWVITIAVRGQHLPDLWKTLLQNHDHLMDILEEDWPGLPRNRYLVCPHCTSLDVENPTVFPGELIDQPPGVAVDLKPCWKTEEMISANLIYPNMPGFSAMKPHQKRALKQHMELLVSIITTPCLSYLLDKLIQEDIITDREKEYIRSKPSTGDTEEAEGAAAAAASVVSPEQTRTLLNILLTKEERAFECLCRCLKNNKQGFLADKLKRC